MAAAVAVRRALLKQLRIGVTQVPPAPSVGVSLAHVIRGHFFSDEAGGTFLDKSEVANRVFSAVNNFQKVDPSKIYYSF